MRIFELALIASLAFAQEDTMGAESQEPAAEEVDDTDYNNWQADVMWADLQAQENPGSKQFSENKESDPNPAWLQLPTTVSFPLHQKDPRNKLLEMNNNMSSFL